MKSLQSIKSSLEKINEGNNPGLAISLVQEGEFILQEFYGNSDLKNQNRINSHTNFNVASMTKQFTALAILLLEQEQLLSVDSSIREILTDAPEAFQNIKIKDLIYHTSGVQDYMNIVSTDVQIKNLHIVDFIYKNKKLNFQPGTKYEYSNSGYVLLTAIIEKITTLNFPNYIQDKILTKLEMNNSKIYCDENKYLIKNKAIGHSEWPLFEELDDCPLNYVFGDGGLYTNMNDILKWIKFLENTELLLTPNYSKKIFSNGMFSDNSPIDYAYGWGIGKYHEKFKIFQHSGSWLGFRSNISYVPAKKLWSILFSNYSGINVHQISLQYLDSILDV